MSTTKITINALVKAEKTKAWECYTNPQDIIHWNFADPSWHCPSASNDLKVGGKYCARMEAKDGSFGFDFEAIYTELNTGESFSYGLGDRNVDVNFKAINNCETEVTVTFDAETQNSIELQRNGWQAILNNYKHYTENN